MFGWPKFWNLKILILESLKDDAQWYYEVFDGMPFFCGRVYFHEISISTLILITETSELALMTFFWKILPFIVSKRHFENQHQIFDRIALNKFDDDAESSFAIRDIIFDI